VPTGGISPPGVPFAPGSPAPGGPVPGAVAAPGALIGPPTSPFPAQRTQVLFAGPDAMKVAWFAPGPDGKPGFTTTQLDVPARYNCAEAAIYRLKLTNIPKRPLVELYPTLEVVPSNSKTCSFLAHNAVPVSFTEEDFDQVLANNYLVKVVYLPDKEFQD